MLATIPCSNQTKGPLEERRGGWLKMMLPGVEVARKRRIHNHEIQPWGPHGNNSQPRGPLYSTMAEPALAARIRLEERLRGVASATPPNPSSRWSQFLRDGANMSWQQNTTPSTNDATASKMVYSVETTQKPTVANGPLSKKVASRAEELCAVCLEKVRGKKKVIRLPCSHQYHRLYASMAGCPP